MPNTAAHFQYCIEEIDLRAYSKKRKASSSANPEARVADGRGVVDLTESDICFKKLNWSSTGVWRLQHESQRVEFGSQRLQYEHRQVQ